MSHGLHKVNKHAQTKMNFEEYLNNINEPPADYSHDIDVQLEAELLEDNYLLRRGLRRTVKKLRRYYNNY